MLAILYPDPFKYQYTSKIDSKLCNILIDIIWIGILKRPRKPHNASNALHMGGKIDG